MNKEINIKLLIASISLALAISPVAMGSKLVDVVDVSIETTATTNEDPMSREEELVGKIAGIDQSLAATDISKDDKKRLKKEKKALQKELKKIESAEKKLAKSLAKKEKARLVKLKKEYGDGPYPFEIEAYTAAQPAELQPFFRSLYIEGERNAVLNFNRLGLAAIESGYDDIAVWAFDNSLERIESIYADDKAAKLAKSKFAAEKVKDFKGEPYERSMAFYYRGLLYLKQGEYQNARASFKSAEFQDTMSEHEDFEADFSVLNYLSGWASQCDGDLGLAKEFYAQAREYNPEIPLPLRTHDTILIGESGLPPIKKAEGKHKEMLKFYPGDSGMDESVSFSIILEEGDSLNSHANHASSVYQQAVTRGGRPIDGLLEGKANFKDNLDTAGNVVSTVGVSTMAYGYGTGNDSMGGAGAVIAIGGLLAKAISNSMKPEADVRYWESLPDDISVVTMSAGDINGAQLVASFTDESTGQTTQTKDGIFIVDAGSCSIGMARSSSAVSVEETAPNARLSWKEMKKQKKEILAKEKSYRAWLEQQTPGQI